MKRRLSRSEFPWHNGRSLVTILCALLLAPGQTVVLSGMTPQSQEPAAASSQEAPKIPADQLESLVAPIALYPDQLMTQVLVASTYPLEIVQLQQWLEKNKNLKDQALVDAVSKQPWDASIQAMAALPDVVKRLSDDIQWTTDLGNAFLAQQSDVMDAVQRMRTKAQGTGALKSNEQLKVETQVVESKSVIVVQQSDPQVVYVPSYNPTVVYGAPAYPYPPIYYPPYTAGAVVAASAISFGVGVAMGAAWGGGWGWGAGWGGNDIDVNVNNNFNRNTNVNGGNRTNVSGGNRTNVGSGNRAGNTGNKWQHNPQHRGGAPYANKSTADRFGGTARGDSMANRQSGARQQIGQQGGNLGSSSAGNRAGGAGVSDRSSGGGSRTGGAGASDRSGGGSNRSSGAGVSDRSSGAGASDRSGGGGNRSSGAGVSDRSSGGSSRGGGGGGDSIGSRNIPSSSGSSSRSGSGFGGGSGGYSGSSSRASSSRGSSSMGSSMGGGGSRGGGGGGGMSRGGGGGGGRRR